MIGCQGEHGLINEPDNSVRSLLREGHFLLLFSHGILLHKWRLVRNNHVSSYIIESWTCDLIHITQWATAILLRLDSDIYQVWFMLLVIQIVICTFASNLTISIFTILTFISACLSSLHWVLTILSCLRRETMRLGLVKLLDSFVFLTWRKFLRCRQCLITWGSWLSRPTACSILWMHLSIMNYWHLLILNILKYPKVWWLLSNLLFTINCLQNFVATWVNVDVVLFWCLNERQIYLLRRMSLLIMLS